MLTEKERKRRKNEYNRRWYANRTNEQIEHERERSRIYNRSHSKTDKGNATNERHGLWKGDKVGNVALHEWIRRHKPTPEYCEHCNLTCPVYDAHNISGNYIRDIDDFIYLCKSCHAKEHYYKGETRRQFWRKIDTNEISCV